MRRVSGMRLAGFLLAGFIGIAGLFGQPAEASASTGKEVSFQTRFEPGSVVIKTSAKKLYYVLENGRAIAYDIAVGRTEEQWFGSIWVSRKAKNPTWIPTKSMREKNPSLPQQVGPGPENPLGIRAIYLGWTAYRIHGTNSPGSIGRAASSGCFRMLNADVASLYERIHVGASVHVLK